MMARIRNQVYTLLIAVAIYGLAQITLIDRADARPSKYAAFVVHENTGKILFSRNANARKHPASLTKIMTLYLVFEALEQRRIKLETEWKVSKRAAKQMPSKLGLRPGEKINVETAILALVTKSANDVAVVVAEALAGSERRFARLMTSKARRLGMRRTTFRNASGLTHRAQLSTARDMAKLARAIRLDFPQYFGYFQTSKFTYFDRTYGNHNRLLGRVKGVDGIKTGYTRASGFNLVSTVSRNGHRLVGVVFGGRTSRERDRHMRDLLDLGFKKARRLPKNRIQRKRQRRGYRYVSYPPRPKFKPIRPLRRDFDDLEYIMAPKNTFIAMPRRGAGGSRQVAMSKLKNTRAKNNRSKGNWSVQVGVFRSYRNVTALAKKTDGLVSRIGGHVKTTINNLGSKRRPLYRARLLGLSGPDARRTCRGLKIHKLDCRVIAPKRVRLGQAKRSRNS